MTTNKNNSQLDVILLSCPSKVMDYPSLSLPKLTGFIAGNNFRIEQKDLNIEIKNLFFTSNVLDSLYSSVIPFMLRINYLDKTNYTFLKKVYNVLSQINKDYGFKCLEGFKTKCQKREYSNVDSHSELLNYIFTLSELCNTLFKYFITYYDLLKANGFSFFLSDYIENLLALLKDKNPRLIGFSVITTQDYFSLWLASKIKPIVSSKILFGGSQPTKHGSVYLKENRFIDYVIIGDGEVPLAKLLTELRSDKHPKLNSVPNLFYRSQDNKIKKGNTCTEVPTEYNNHYFPSYEGFPLSLYLSPIMPIMASRGCPWLLCKFCAHRTTFFESYSERNPQDVVDEMNELKARYGTNLFHFADETIKANLGIQLSKLIQESGNKYYWMSFARLDDEFNYDVLSQWYQGGNLAIEWGLESGSQKVLDSMHKGISIDKAQEIINVSGAIGIKNKLLTWHNYPNESISDLVKTINFVTKNTEMDLASPMLTLYQRFALQKGSEDYEQYVDNNFGGSVFKKILLPNSIYDINAGYVYKDDKSQIKKDIIDNYLLNLKELCLKKNIYVASNESISFDLLFKYLKKAN